VCAKLAANHLNHNAKSFSREALFSFSWHFHFKRRGSASGSDLGKVDAEVDGERAQ
jgi:hypothetical protein